MADIGAELKTYLKTISAITDLVGATTAARIHSHLARQKWTTPPWIVFGVLAGTSYEDLTGPSGLITSHIQIDAYGTSEAQAKSLHDAIHTALMVTNGAGRYTMGSTYIHGVTSVGGFEEDHETPQPGKDISRYICSRDYQITYGE